MKSTSSYYIAVRWWSLGQMTSWYQGYYDKICGYVGLKAPDLLPSKMWWLILSGLNCYLEEPVLFDKLKRNGRPGTTFAYAWSPLRLRFKYLRLLACGLAAFMPSSLDMECDFSRIN
jgi:hypothetical protein